MNEILISALGIIFFAGVITLILILGRRARKKIDESFELSPERFYHVIVKSKDPYVDKPDDEFGCIHFIDKMTCDPIDVDVSFDDYLKVLVNDSYNLVLKGNKIIDLRNEDF